MDSGSAKQSSLLKASLAGGKVVVEADNEQYSDGDQIRELEVDSKAAVT